MSNPYTDTRYAEAKLYLIKDIIDYLGILGLKEKVIYDTIKESCFNWLIEIKESIKEKD